MKNILVAYDGSETSKRAIDTAADLIASDARASPRFWTL